MSAPVCECLPTLAQAEVGSPIPSQRHLHIHQTPHHHHYQRKGMGDTDKLPGAGGGGVSGGGSGGGGGGGSSGGGGLMLSNSVGSSTGVSSPGGTGVSSGGGGGNGGGSSRAMADFAIMMPSDDGAVGGAVGGRLVERRLAEERDLLLLGPAAVDTEEEEEDEAGKKRRRWKEEPRRGLAARSQSAYKSGQEAFLAVIHSWATKRFMSGCAILFPMAVTYYVTWWFFTFVDGFFSPIYRAVFKIHILGLGFVTSFIFIFCVGVFVSSYVGASILWLGEWIIKRMPLIKHIYSASKQISNAISPDQNVNAFKEVAIIRHPRMGEYAFGFITSTLTLQHESGDEEELCSVYVPTNHVYIGDIFLVNQKDVIRPQLSVREGIEIVVSGGMSMPARLRPVDQNLMSPERRPLL